MNKTTNKNARLWAFRYWNGQGRGRWYVSDTPHPKGSKIALRKGVDWGYDTIEGKAIVLSLYWARRFRADCIRVGAAPYFIDLNTNQFVNV